MVAVGVSNCFSSCVSLPSVVMCAMVGGCRSGSRQVGGINDGGRCGGRRRWQWGVLGLLRSTEKERRNGGGGWFSEQKRAEGERWWMLERRQQSPPFVFIFSAVTVGWRMAVVFDGARWSSVVVKKKETWWSQAKK